MEFAQCFRLLLVAACVWHCLCRQHGAILAEAATRNRSTWELLHVCQGEETNFQFPVFPLVTLPSALKFMIALSPICTNRSAECLNKCLSANSISTQLSDCNASGKSQTWFQLNNLFFNVQEKKCLAYSDLSDSAPTLKTCNFSDINQKWTCRKENILSGFLLQTNSSLHRYITTTESYQINITNAPSTVWQVLDGNGKQQNSVACRKFQRYCGLPIPGLRSYIVSSRLDFSVLAHIPPLQLQQTLQYDMKLCYTSGERILISCAKGSVALGTNGSTYKLMTCIGGGFWANPKPLHCVKRICGQPRRHKHTVISGGEDYAYGDSIQYRCVSPYIGEDATQVCGPDGVWMGEQPNCKHSCHFNFTGRSGQILSPKYPQPYPNNVKCEWLISVAPGLRIALWLRDFYLEVGSLLLGECRYDVLYIQDTPVDASKGVKRLCGSSHPKHWYSTANVIMVGFHSDYLVQGKGFKIDYTTWNSSISDLPTEPARNGTFPDEEDKSNVYIATDYANFVLQIFYVTVVAVAVMLVLKIIFFHMYNTIKDYLHVEPEEEDFVDEQERKRRLAQRRMTTVFDPMTITPSIVINPALLSSNLSSSGTSTSSSRSTIKDFEVTTDTKETKTTEEESAAVDVLPPSDTEANAKMLKDDLPPEKMTIPRSRKPSILKGTRFAVGPLTDAAKNKPKFSGV